MTLADIIDSIQTSLQNVGQNLVEITILKISIDKVLTFWFT